MPVADLAEITEPATGLTRRNAGLNVQRLIAIACGVPIGEHDEVVPPPLRRER